MKKNVMILLTGLLAVSIVWGCESRKNVSREEIPIIKESIIAFESVLKAKNTAYLDSLLSSEAADAGMTPDLILAFVYADGLTQFVGFTEKQIYFRGDAARCDCMITGPDGPTRAVTITLKLEHNIWLIKKIEPRIIDSPYKNT